MKRPGWLQDPAAPAMVLYAVLVVVGLLAVGLGWRVAAETRFVPSQMAALVSGGFGGIALVIIGTGCLVAQVGRRLAALERVSADELLDEASELLAAYRETRGGEQ